jgi:galactonate dehydratase
MKITDIKTILADGGARVFVFVKIETDQPGLIGWGEASLESKPRAVVGCVADMAPMIIGEDPLRIEYLWQILYRGAFWRQGVIGMSAISGIDQALWDIKGKEAGKPVFELLGGRVRDKVRMYTHFGGRTTDAMIKNALSKVAKGWTAIKTVPMPPTNLVDGPKIVKDSADQLGAVRAAVGDSIDILLDFHGRVSPQMAIQYAKAYEPYHPLFIEEPVPAEGPDAMAQVKRATSIPVATGERLFTRWGFRRILETEAASLLQPDCCHAGGISELRKIGTMAEVYYAGLAPHNPYGPVSTAACIQVDFVAPNFVIQENVDPDDIPEAMTFVKEPLPVVNGHIFPPTRPGIGVEVDEAACAKCPPDYSISRVRQQNSGYLAHHPDGGIADS